MDIADEDLIDQRTDFAWNIDVLIGSDHSTMWSLVTSSEETVAPLRLIVSGSAYAKTAADDGTLTQLIVQKPDSTALSEGDGELTNALRRFWDTESLRILEPESVQEMEFL